MMPRHSCFVIVVLVLAAAHAAGDTHYVTPSDNWFDLINGDGLSPGDEVVLGAGTYSDSSRLSIGHQGTTAEPIVIRAADGAAVTITRPDAAQNVINLEGARYLTLRGIEVTAGSAGIRISENGAGQDAKFITIEDSHVHHTDDAAITANHEDQTYEGMIFRRNEIHHTGGTGEAFYLGSNYNKSQFYDGLIENNYIHDLISNNSNFQGDGIEIKDGSYGNTVRNNVIVNTNYPGIIVYGTNGNAPNVIEGNVVIDTDSNGIQACSEAVIRNNIIYGADINSIESHDHQNSVVGDLTIVHNTIISNGNRAINANSDSGSTGTVVIANNALYHPGTDMYLGSSLSTTVQGNVQSSSLASDFEDVANWEFFPIPGSALIGAGVDLAALTTALGLDPAMSAVVLDDFNDTLRSGDQTAGAYVYDAAGNPGWDVQAGFNPIPEPATLALLSAGMLALICRRNKGDRLLCRRHKNVRDSQAAATCQ